MKIIEPSVSLHTPFGQLDTEAGIRLLRWIEFNARVSHRSEEAQTPDSWKRFLPAVVIEHGDWSVVEHSSVTAIFRVDRGVTHELVRHRLFSFTQESTRFVNYRKKTGEEGIEFVLPTEYSRHDASTCVDPTCEGNCDFDGMTNSFENAEDAYMALLAEGVRPQEARAVLPNGLAATITVTGNLRNWRHLLLMRTSKETHPDFRRVTIPLLSLFQSNIPILYDDIEPNQRQIDNLKKPR